MRGEYFFIFNVQAMILSLILELSLCIMFLESSAVDLQTFHTLML